MPWLHLTGSWLWGKDLGDVVRDACVLTSHLTSSIAFKEYEQYLRVNERLSAQAGQTMSETNEVVGEENSSEVSGSPSEVSGNESEVSVKANEASGKARKVSVKASEVSGKASEVSEGISDLRSSYTWRERGVNRFSLRQT
eukprot:GHVN01003792.1.p1 GENE.GHVN01003792.1~~GHVN01003792.1.p1  ORF type:complete len:141 (-),score=59.58 GHVN01003792.1:323-745(-)